MTALGLILGDNRINRIMKGRGQFFKDLFCRTGDIDGQDKGAGEFQSEKTFGVRRLRGEVRRSAEIEDSFFAKM